MTLRAQLAELVSACFTGIWVLSHEHQDALAEIAQLCRDERWPLAVWNVHRGLQLPGQRVAMAVLETRLQQSEDHVVFWGVYSTMDDEIAEDEGEPSADKADNSVEGL